MYKKISIHGLRGIKEFHLENVKQVNLFVGKNNCGKSTILDGIFLLTGPTNPELPRRINSFRNYDIIDDNGWSVIYNNFDTNEPIFISGDLINPEQNRKLKILPRMESSSTTTTKTIDKDNIDIDTSFSSVSSKVDGLKLEYTLIKHKHKKPEKIVTDITKSGPGLKITFATNYKEELSGTYLNQKTIFSDVVQKFNNIQIKKQTHRIIKILKEIEPRLENINIGTDDLIYCDVGLDRLIPINVMGDGILRLLSIIVAIFNSSNGVVLIDEIENGFHHSSQKILWKALLSAAKEFNVQIFATTHSLECIHSMTEVLKENSYPTNNLQLIRIERKNGNIKSIEYDYETLVSSLESNWEVR